MPTAEWLEAIESVVRESGFEAVREVAVWVLAPHWAALGRHDHASSLLRSEPATTYQFASRAVVRGLAGDSEAAIADIRLAIHAIRTADHSYQGWHVRDVAKVPARYAYSEAAPEILSWIDGQGRVDLLAHVSGSLVTLGQGGEVARRCEDLLRWTQRPSWMLPFILEALATSGKRLSDEAPLREALHAILQRKPPIPAHSLGYIVRAASITLIGEIHDALRTRPAWADDCNQGRSWMSARAQTAGRLLREGRVECESLREEIEECWLEQDEEMRRCLSNWYGQLTSVPEVQRPVASGMMFDALERLDSQAFRDPEHTILLDSLISAMCKLGDAPAFHRFCLGVLDRINGAVRSLTGDFSYLTTVPASVFVHGAHLGLDLATEARAAMHVISSAPYLRTPFGDHRIEAELRMAQTDACLGRVAEGMKVLNTHLPTAAPPGRIDLMERSRQAAGFLRYLPPDDRLGLLRKALPSVKAFVETGYYLRDHTFIEGFVDALDERPSIGRTSQG